jgi:hypothetical protein
MRIIPVLFVLALTMSAKAQNKVNHHSFGRKNDLMKVDLSISNRKAHLQQPSTFLTDAMPGDSLTLRYQIFRNASQAKYSNPNARIQSPLKKLKKSALVKYYNLQQQEYEDYRTYLYKHESDTSFWEYAVAKDELGNFTDTVEYTLIRYSPSLTDQYEVEYKSYYKYGNTFYLTSYGTDLSFTTYEEDGENQKDWFWKTRLDLEYALDEETNQYYLNNKWEETYDDKRREILSLYDTYDQEGKRVYGYKQELTEVFANGETEETWKQYQTLEDYGDYVLVNLSLVKYDANEKILTSKNMDYDFDNHKLDSARRYNYYYDAQGRLSKQLQYYNYDAANNTWKNANRLQYEYSDERSYEYDDNLTNGVWVKYARRETIETVGKKEIIVALWNNNAYNNNLKWEYVYYETGKLKTLKTYLWNGSVWYFGEFNNYQYYEYNEQRQQTLFITYRRFDRNNTYKIIREYDAQNRQVKVSQFNAYTNNVNDIPWDNAYETTYQHNAFGKQVAYDFKRWRDGEWIWINKNSLLTDEDGNELEYHYKGYNWETGVQHWGYWTIYTLTKGDYATKCPKPTITLTGENTEGITLTTGTAQAYQWFKDNESIAGATSASYGVHQPGVYTVRTTTDLCLTFSDLMPIVITGLEEPLARAISVYPNPTVNKITIDVSSLSTDRSFHVSIYDGAGRTINTFSGKDSITLDLDSYTPGNYWVRIQARQHAITRHIVKH